jgi:hypothetical protein
MTGHRPDVDRMLRWYPGSWRARYGDEFAALIEDDLDGGRPTLRLRASLVRAGLYERGRGAALIGRSCPADERERAGSLVVLAAWTAFVVAGSAFAKASEHFAESLPPSTSSVARGADTAVLALAAVGAALVVAGAVAAAPALVRHLRTGGWPQLKRPVVRATVLTVATVAGLVLMVGWASHLDLAQRNGADAAYGWAALALGIVGTAALAQWAAAAIGAARQMDFGPRVLRFESALAVGVAVAMTAMALAVAVWWGSIARLAPWFLQGTRPGTRPSPVSVQMVVIEGVMVAAAAAAAYGVVRIGRAWRVPAD